MFPIFTLEMVGQIVGMVPVGGRELGALGADKTTVPLLTLRPTIHLNSKIAEFKSPFLTPQIMLIDDT